MRRKTATLILLIVTFFALPGFAGSATATFSVSAEVVARTILSIDSQPTSINITSADVTRGYIDLPHAVTFRVRSNASGGYAMQFQPVGYPFSQVTMSWGDSVATIGSDGTWLTRPYQAGTTTGAFSVRLMLAPGTSAGTYAWPVAFVADSL